MTRFIPEKDTVLANLLGALAPGSSKRTQQSWLKAGRVLVDGRIARDGRKVVRANQEVTLTKAQTTLGKGLRIVYSDRDIVVVDKPAGMLSVAAEKSSSISAHLLLKRHFRPQRVFVLHRLDQDTSGVFAFALSEHALHKLKNLFYTHDIERTYLAVVEGRPDKDNGTWESYLREDSAYFMHSSKDQARGERAVTHYRVIASSARYSCLEITLETGKKNQIRVHCNEAGCPVVGERKYGTKEQKKTNRLCLHARQLAFPHPITSKSMTFTSPIPGLFFFFFPNLKES